MALRQKLLIQRLKYRSLSGHGAAAVNQWNYRIGRGILHSGINIIDRQRLQRLRSPGSHKRSIIILPIVGSRIGRIIPLGNHDRERGFNRCIHHCTCIAHMLCPVIDM